MPKRVNIFYSQYVYEPETIDYFNTIGIAEDSTVYFASTIFEKTGKQLWRAVNKFVAKVKTDKGLTLGVNNLKDYIDVIHLFLGGTSTRAKTNLCNPLDTNAAFRLTFSGGWTYNGGGAQPNGTNGYAIVHWTSSANGASNRVAYGKYMRTADTTGVHGVWDLTNATRLYDQINTAAGVYTIGNTGGLNTASPYTRFHAIAVRAASTKTFSNNAIRLSPGVLSHTTTNLPFYIGARNNNNASVNQYTNGQLGFFFITGKVELSDTDVLNLNAAVDQLMLDLGRNV